MMDVFDAVLQETMKKTFELCEEAQMYQALAAWARETGNEEQEEFLAAMAEIETQADEETELLFDGKDDCTEEEGEIIFSDLSIEEKMAKLHVLRGSTVKPKTFKKRVTPDDVIRAKALGVRLD